MISDGLLLLVGGSGFAMGQDHQCSCLVMTIFGYLFQILACWDLVGYCRCVCAEIANSLGIQVFRIVPKVTDSAASTAAASGSTNGSRNGRHKKS